MNVVAAERRQVADVDGIVIQPTSCNRGGEIGGEGLHANDAFARAINHTHSPQRLGGLGVQASEDGTAPLRSEGAHDLCPFRFRRRVFLDKEAVGLGGAHLAHMCDEASDVSNAYAVTTSEGWRNDDVPNTGNGRGD